MELERFDEAREELELVLKSDPRNLAAVRALAETHRRRGAWSEALQQYRAALELASNDPDLERTVNELATKASRPAPAPAPASPLEQSRQPAQGGQVERRVLASLEQWLAAIHATRANPRP
jgi:tetratricopeptide (TPR) repeat protein